MEPVIRYNRHQPLDVKRLGALFVAAWSTSKPGHERVLAHSFTWVAASSGDELVGFANVAWDGGAHFFLLDTTVHPSWMRGGIGRRLVEEAIEACRGRGEWLHVDAAEELMTGFYQRCGFQLRVRDAAGKRPARQCQAILIFSGSSASSGTRANTNIWSRAEIVLNRSPAPATGTYLDVESGA